MKTLILAAVIYGLIGCNGTNAPGNSGSPSESPSSSATPSESPTSSPSPTATSGGASLKDIPAEFQSDAYRYYGLSNPEPLKLQMEQGSGTAPGALSTGDVQATLQKVEKDGVLFEYRYSGDLSTTLGTSQMKLGKDGIHALSTGMGKVTGDDLELPAKLAPGVTWHTKNTVETGGETVREDITYKVVGLQHVDTKLDTYKDALCVVGSGTMSRGGKSFAVTAKSWYVKDRGAVRQEMTVKTTPPTVITIQERKAS